MRLHLLYFEYMKHSRLAAFGWFLISSTFLIAAPKTKHGEGKQAKKPACFSANQQTQKKVFVPKSSVKNDALENSGWETIVYKAQRMASDMTQEVGYLFKQSGPWLKELEDEIRGVNAPAAGASASTKKFGKQAALPQATKAKASAPKRQLGNMAQPSPNKLVEMVTSLSRETWEKVQVAVADIMGSAPSNE